MNNQEYEKKIAFYRAKQERKLERYTELAQKSKEESKVIYEHGRSIADAIPFGQPILVGHHSEKRHRRDIERIQNSMNKSIELENKADQYTQRAENIENPRGISSDDPEATQKLKQKLEDMLKERDEIKSREHKGWELSNLSGNMRRVKQRIQELESLEKIEEVEKTKNGITLTVDKIENRVKLQFPAKPNQETIDKLKSRGFKWSPYNKVWQRMISGYAIELARGIQEEQREIDK